MSVTVKLSLVVLVNLWASLCCVTPSDVQRVKRSDDDGPLVPVVNHLSQQMESVIAQLAALQSKTASLDKMVAFHAKSSSSVHTLGNSIIILGHADLNVGNAYDPLTGVFTVPVPGLYDFQASFMNAEYNTATTFCRCEIMVDGARQVIGISDSRDHVYDHSSMRVVLHLNAGQKVYLNNPDDDRAHLYYDKPSLPYTTFSGFLIKAD